MNRFLLIATMCAGAAALAKGDATAQVRDALESQAIAPATPPTLPDAASEKARTAHAELAFGQKGAAERAAHSQASEHARSAAQGARDDAANEVARGIAAGTGNRAAVQEHEAAGQARAAQVREGQPLHPPSRGGKR